MSTPNAEIVVIIFHWKVFFTERYQSFLEEGAIPEM